MYIGYSTELRRICEEYHDVTLTVRKREPRYGIDSSLRIMA
jgi:hypothetical protein